LSRVKSLDGPRVRGISPVGNADKESRIKINYSYRLIGENKEKSMN